MSSISAARAIHYPDSDGKPMGETPRHVKTMLQTYGTLDLWFQNDPQVFVGCNMFIYYQEGSPRKHVSPDVFAVRGIPKERKPERRNYKIWQEGGKGPDWVLEVTSGSTRNEDLDSKFKLYRDVLRVQEYFLFDPYEEYLHPALCGYRREGQEFIPILAVGNRVASKVLGLELETDGLDLRLYDPKTRQRLKTLAELAQENEELKRKTGRAKRRGKD
jgi:Uma2 family endonuclease